MFNKEASLLSNPNLISGVTSASSFLSLVGSLSTIVTYKFYKRLRNKSNTIPLSLAMSDFLTALAFSVGSLASMTENPTLCVIQGMSIQIFMITSALWTTSLSLHILGILYGFTHIKMIYSHIINWSLPLVIAMALPFFGDGKVFVYGESGVWCWISKQYGMVRMFAFYIPIWIMLMINLMVFFRVWMYLQKTRERRYSFSFMIQK